MKLRQNFVRYKYNWWGRMLIPYEYVARQYEKTSRDGIPLIRPDCTEVTSRVS